jgi:hypothetical protein
MQLVRNGVNDLGYGHIDDIRGNVAQFDRMMQQSKFSRQKKDAAFTASLSDIDTKGVNSLDQPIVNKMYSDFRNWAVSKKPVKGTREENIKFQSDAAAKRQEVVSTIDFLKQSRSEGSAGYKMYGSKLSEEGDATFKNWMGSPLIDDKGERKSLNWNDMKFKPEDYDLNTPVQKMLSNSMMLGKQIGDYKTKADGRTETEFGDILNLSKLVQSAKIEFETQSGFKKYITNIWENTPEIKVRFSNPEDAAGAIVIKMAAPGMKDEDYLKAISGELTEYVQHRYKKDGGSRYPQPRSSSESGGSGGVAGMTPAQRVNIIDMFVGATFAPTPDNIAQAMQNLGYIYIKPDKQGNKQTGVRFENGKVIIEGADEYGEPLDNPLKVIDFRRPDAPGALSLLFDQNVSAKNKLGNAGWNYKKSAYGDVWIKGVGVVTGNKSGDPFNTGTNDPFPQAPRPVTTPAVKPAAKPDATPAAKPDAKPDATPAAKPDATPDAAKAKADAERRKKLNDLKNM